MRAFVLVVLVGLAAALDLDAEWVNFKKAYDKQYKTVEEEKYR
jgi:hypothetical protein